MRKIYDVDVLLDSYRKRQHTAFGRLVKLTGLNGFDGYNPSNAVSLNGHIYHYVRVEPRADEFGAWSALFRQKAVDVWEMDDVLPMLRLQDPFVARIHGELIVGGVRILARAREYILWETVLLRGDSPETLIEFSRSPRNMKDVRLVELEGGKVGVFTRPLGGIGGRGRIGYAEIANLDMLTTDVMERAELLETQPIDEHWWGVNDVYALSTGLLGVLAHIAKFEGLERHYYPIAFVFDRHARTIVDGPRIIAERACFPPTAPKNPILSDVIFPSGIDRPRGLLYGGLSDSAIGILEVGDPFERYE